MPSRPNSMLVALIVACALFMQNLDSTIIATALPQMAVSFDTSPISLNLGITAYILTVAVFIPISGWIADRWGSRTIFCTAIGVFTLGSILCGFSGSLAQFIAARVLQGLGGAMMIPVGQLVVLRGTEKSMLVRAMNFISVPGLVAPVIGPPVGGFITTYASWHWIFFLNLPVGLAGMVLVALFIENHRAPERRPLDWIGFGLTGVALICLTYGLEEIGHGQGEWRSTGLLFLGGSLLATLAIRHARHHAHPLLDLSPLSIRTYALATGGGSLFRLTVGAFSYLLPLMFQVAFGLSAFVSGMLILAHASGDLFMKAVTRRAIRTFGFRSILVVNGILIALSNVGYSLFWPSSPVPLILLVLFVGGLARSLQFTSLNTLAFADVAPPKMSASSALSGLIQQVSLGSGVAFAAILLQGALVLRGADGGALATGDFHLAFGAVSVVALVSSLIFLALPIRAGAEVSGHRPAVARDASAGE